MLARKPISKKSIRDNVWSSMAGAINIDRCRIGNEERDPIVSSLGVLHDDDWSQKV